MPHRTVWHVDPQIVLFGNLDLECPEELTDPVARAEWSRSIAPAISSGHVTALDRSLAISHCEVWASRRALLAEAAGVAPVIASGRDKRLRAHPVVTMAGAALTLLLKIDAELGLTPVSRSRVKLAPRATKTPLALVAAKRTYFEGDGGG
jgi:P27 family predicted phage terminase small subunit